MGMDGTGGAGNLLWLVKTNRKLGENPPKKKNPKGNVQYRASYSKLLKPDMVSSWKISPFFGPFPFI